MQVILIQEQLSKNRIIIDMDSKGRYGVSDYSYFRSNFSVQINFVFTSIMNAVSTIFLIVDANKRLLLRRNIPAQLGNA